MRPLSTAGVLALVLGVVACGEDVDQVERACDDYCELVMRNCTGGVAQYTDLSTCMATCEAMPLGEPASPAGDTIACRTFYAAVAEDDKTNACTKAGPGGADTCGNDCDSFCALAMAICEGQPGSFPDLATCQSACAGFDASEPYDASDVDGDTFACRLYHLTAASTAPDVHCSHIVAASPLCL